MLNINQLRIAFEGMNLRYVSEATGIAYDRIYKTFGVVLTPAEMAVLSAFVERRNQEVASAAKSAI